MTELDVMRHAKDYLDKLSRGIDPLTDQPVPEGDIVRGERLQLCFVYVSGVLEKVIAQGGVTTPGRRNGGPLPFALPLALRERYVFSDSPVQLSAIAGQLNEMVDKSGMKRLKATSITQFLLQGGFLAEHERPDGRKYKRPTEQGLALGISTERRTSANGEYTVMLYDRQAQHFILDNLDAVIDLSNAPLHENQGKPWTTEEDAYLRRRFREGRDVKELSTELGRTRASIRARLEKLGLTAQGTQG